MWNLATLYVINSSLETIIFDPQEMLGMLDLRLVGYYKIWQGILQQNLSKYYRFKSTDILCQQFDKFINTLKKKRKMKEKYLWLQPDNKRKNMSDREILDKCIDLNQSHLLDLEKKQVMDMLYKYKDAFHLRDEIGTCMNIEVEIDVTDESPFFVRLHHVKAEDKDILDKEMERLCHLGILKEGFSAYSGSVMLISRKVKKDKTVMTNFGHLNVWIAKNNLAYPLLKDTFSALGSSRCALLLVLDLKDAFHSQRLLKNYKRYCGILPFFGSAVYLYQRMAMGLNIIPLIWQSYINTILDSLQSRKYCKAIMDDLILFTPTRKSHIAILEDLLKPFLKIWLMLLC